MKQKQKQTIKGAQAFEEYYSTLYGSRWEDLKKAFFNENTPVEYKITGAQNSYFLDSASVFAALCLPLNGPGDEGEEILDLCAAPGGKTLVLASRMNQASFLSANERSPERKHRLSVVVQTCLPQEISSRVKVSCSDGSTWCTRQSECFDKILLDAPCSSERHVIADPKYLNQWSESRIKTVSMEQWALLSSAFRLLKPHGIMVYSTCALSPQENDLMIERLFKKFKGGFELLPPEPCAAEISDFTAIHLPDFEKTKYGYAILPDKQKGAGPIFFTIIQKIHTVLS